MKKSTRIMVLIIGVVIIILIVLIIILSSNDINIYDNNGIDTSKKLSENEKIKKEIEALSLFHMQFIEKIEGYDQELLTADEEGDIHYDGMVLLDEEAEKQYNTTDIFERNDITIDYGRVAAKDPSSETARIIDSILGYDEVNLYE